MEVLHLAGTLMEYLLERNCSVKALKNHIETPVKLCLCFDGDLPSKKYMIGPQEHQQKKQQQSKY